MESAKEERIKAALTQEKHTSRLALLCLAQVRGKFSKGELFKGKNLKGQEIASLHGPMNIRDWTGGPSWLSFSHPQALGRSVSIIPQARSLVQNGPYKFVRHPLYLGELIAILGIVTARFSIYAMSVFCLLVALQIYRAMQEERLLAGTFPEYESYSLKRARFIPGIY